jgi:hypothetical protein
MIHFKVGGFLRCSESINWLLFLIFVVSSLLVFVGTTLACVNIGNISKGNKLDLPTNIFSLLKLLNITIICVNIIVIILIVIFSIYLFITPQFLQAQENIAQYKTYKDENKANNECYDFQKINEDEDEDEEIEYNNGNGDFKNNDKNYNSSDFNNNLLPNQTHQTNNGL